MIDFLRGTLHERTPTRAVIDVGGVGYGVAISLTTYDRLPSVGTEIFLHTYTYVREDRLDLYGFADAEERRMFTLLLSVSGIGPNSAQTVLSGMSISDLQSAITQDRVTDLTQIRGVGRKTAERVVVELRDKIASIAGATGSVSATGPVDQGVTAEAILALVALGINESTATKSVDKAMKKSDGEATVQDLIKNALRDR
ncbi:MAG TPA: Holliday junction branch migration protein RuvA [Candidatus Latescibacteria bacterium]|nr:Holliday junction branch migration protein RuvA [Candidatus Latescibacterota bacterium]HJN30793.1 Holliday junction branch migration protein RuvA [Candidatus Latescibacterota bacterium]